MQAVSAWQKGEPILQCMHCNTHCNPNPDPNAGELIGQGSFGQVANPHRKRIT